MRPLTLLCLPYAGGSSAVFRDWEGRLPSWIKVRAVDLPGHGMRTGEASLSEWEPLLDWLLSELRWLRSPFAIFGHSMGALVGFELAHALRRVGRPGPVWFGASGCTAPSRRQREMKWLVCPEAELVAELQKLGGTPPELLQHRELLDLVLPTLRNDFHLCGSYSRADRAALDCPILVLGGTRDTDVSDPSENLSAWALETKGPCTVHMIDDGHFFIDSRRDEVLVKLAHSLAHASATRGALYA
ncbi:thioesterase II family protein [Agrobacterium tumefaciens]|uniref:thioesterase II family protein n=1 Tax=Agrobacterium tumefaciens TaxID=358 RepID=UPI002243AA88|nr:alpha/beta fold hydrolase [Agrobacterium tumefaciens]MCW8060864.1 alpha/beta fold hydrolase [Agrobacterium tumefaciens]